MSDLEKLVAEFVANLPREFLEEAVRQNKARNKKYSEMSQSKPDYREKKRKHDRLRNERVKKASEGLSADEKKKIKIFYGMCPLGMEVDHIVPISKGGKHCVENLQYLTREENYRKGIKMPDEPYYYKKS